MRVKDIKILIYLIIFLFVFLIAYFLIKPAMIEIRNKKVEIKTNQKILEQKENTLLKFIKISAKYKKHKSDIKKMDQILLQKPDPLLIFIQLDALALNNKMAIKSISFGNLELSDKGVGVLSADITAEGTYSSFKDFLEAVAKNLNLMDIETMSTEVEKVKIIKKGEEEIKIYSFSLTVNIYTKEIPVEEKPQKPPETEELEF